VKRNSLNLCNLRNLWIIPSSGFEGLISLGLLVPARLRAGY
jgi:hypothetical protein